MTYLWSDDNGDDDELFHCYWLVQAIYCIAAVDRNDFAGADGKGL